MINALSQYETLETTNKIKEQDFETECARGDGPSPSIIEIAFKLEFMLK